MNKGYHYVSTIPKGACNASAFIKDGQSKNIIALRWTLFESYFFNGDWAIKESGRYTASKNVFTYEEASGENSSIGDRISFETQLTHSIDVCLLVRGKNRGVQVRYILPPMKKNGVQSTKVKEEKSAEANHMEKKTRTATDNNAISTGMMERKTSTFDRGELNLEAANKGMENTLRYLSYDKNKRLSNGGSSPLSVKVGGSGRPKWVDELGHVLTAWKTKIDSMEDAATALKQRVAELETEKDKLKKQVDKIRKGVTKHLKSVQICETGHITKQLFHEHNGFLRFKPEFISQPTVLRFYKRPEGATVLYTELVSLLKSFTPTDVGKDWYFLNGASEGFFLACGWKDLSDLIQ